VQIGQRCLVVEVIVTIVCPDSFQNRIHTIGNRVEDITSKNSLSGRWLSKGLFLAPASLPFLIIASRIASNTGKIAYCALFDRSSGILEMQQLVQMQA
jgi:hypothetical protein